MNLPGWIRWEGRGGRVNGRLSFGWAVMCWVGRFGVLVFGVAEGGKECVRGGVSKML